MTNYRVQEKDKKYTVEVIEAESSTDAKKAYRAKHDLDIKLSGLETRVILAPITQERALHISWIYNCDESSEFECCNCLGTIEAHEAHSELVLYASENEIGMVAAMHNEC